MLNLSVYDIIIEAINAIAEILIATLFYHRILVKPSCARRWDIPPYHENLAGALGIPELIPPIRRRGFQSKKYNSSIKYVAAYSVAYAVLLTSLFNVASPSIRIGVTFVIVLSVSFFIYDGSKTVKLFASIYLILIFFFSKTLFFGILACIGYGDPYDLLKSNMGRILGMAGTNIFAFWMTVYSCCVYKNKVKSLPFKYWICIILIPFFSALILIQILPANHGENNVMIGYIISVCGVLCLNFLAFNYFESYDKEIKLAALE